MSEASLEMKFTRLKMNRDLLLIKDFLNSIAQLDSLRVLQEWLFKGQDKQLILRIAHLTTWETILTKDPR